MRAVAIAAALATTALATSASAQPVKPLVPVTPSDTLLLPDARDVMALQPLRLGLQSSAVPHAWNTPGCEPAGQPTGIAPMPNHGVAANGIRLSRDLRLTLFGFASDGCAYDRNVGGGLAFTIPLKKDVTFMWGGGAIYLPHGGPGGQPRTETEVRAGITWTTKDGRSYNVGISARSGGPHVSFGGAF